MTRVCALAELEDRQPVSVDVDGTPVVVVRDGDEVHALHDVCSHAEVALSEGEVTRRGIECWLHGSCFDLRTGKPNSLPATEPVDVFAVSVRDGDVYVDTTAVLN
ncbi:3-phenylpropionate/trans-cinnamate dioxygenase ferredoxin subunit [Streptoalloteichus tenebrarius]|uniref:3-phenylpropionate/trans-cinnamate dioxygenase ferredoxin subunit n=1 Tax=Streptoalloteichus tenebrarius (strain ATCC 17920 / DSM 40477 / JCM 4838 / CBS 697.72 / NBRC 16177 / NCIMB 11028 / NRRL B-12390 / A12253. 1 / ISP 5477) TaxID=1933 RepID=A0ABT1HT16_STRSD|nr:non-heme iron oxygenase ferredoxin subunit [Streptoalloteichus tenebrarius]MCP2258560.1 3-phenylpropionate/trans-cinnamate dioxygenase ferredoxin subunit [Streptoalloteichus tenebrarius]BFF04071.1 non-heme iron oxygenase ferredoxin subunit [Streptoalloteichus tenebrarius]